MPTVTDKCVVYLPNKAGPNNAVEAWGKITGLGETIAPRNGVEASPFLNKNRIVIMTAGHPFGRLASLHNYYCERRKDCPRMIGWTFEEYCRFWIDKHLNDKEACLSRYMTLTECMEECDASMTIVAERMHEGLELLNDMHNTSVSPKQLGNHFNACKHRLDWREKVESLTAETHDQLETLLEDDLCWLSP